MNILIVDDQPIVKEGLERLFEDQSDLKIVADTDSAQNGMSLLRKLPVDLVLMEMALPDMDGAEAIRLYIGEFPQVKIIIYTHHEEEGSVYRALKAGASGYLLKNSSLEDILAALRQSRRERYVLSPELSPAIIGFYLEHRNCDDDLLGEYQSLTKREKQVFRLLADGQETDEIAEILYISPKTVAKHRSSVKKKLNLNNVAEIVQYAINIGVLKINSRT